MWSMPVVLTDTENENDSVNKNYVAKITLQKWCCKNDAAKMTLQNDVAGPNNVFLQMAQSPITHLITQLVYARNCLCVVVPYCRLICLLTWEFFWHLFFAEDNRLSYFKEILAQATQTKASVKWCDNLGSRSPWLKSQGKMLIQFKLTKTVGQND